jgi:hypothetical protein
MFLIILANLSRWALNYFGESVSLAPLVSSSIGSLAQSVEQQAFNLLVLRSNRRRPTN